MKAQIGPMRIKRLKLSGFKSFVEPAELRIEPGLTGVVGPNGCGKSNLLEAIRWVMGESSPKSMRGGGMEDVIGAAKVSLGLMFARPMTPSYPELSAILQKNIQQVLLGQASPEDALAAAAKAAERLR